MSCAIMDLKRSVFEVQWCVIPLKKALTKLFVNCFITKYCLLVKILTNLPKYFMLGLILPPLTKLLIHAKPPDLRQPKFITV